MEAKYPSDINREQFEVVRSLLESACKSTRPRTVDLYEVFCAVLYRLPMAALSSDFPIWRRSHAYFQIWSEVNDDGVSLLRKPPRQAYISKVELPAR